MLRNLLSNNNAQDNSSYPASKQKNQMMVIFVLLIVLVVGVTIIVALLNRPDKHTQSATEAARKEIPNAEVKDVRVAGGFATATVSDPTSGSQILDGNVMIFKVSEDGSMTQIANGNSFTPIDLLALDIPLKTQAELLETDLSQITQNLAGTCGYGKGDAPGYYGFDGYFEPDRWQIDSGTLDDIQQVLTTKITNDNSTVEYNDKTICVNATGDNSNVTTDMKTYISTFTLDLEFISGGGEITTRTFTFSIGPNYYHAYTLDGRKLAYVSD